MFSSIFSNSPKADPNASNFHPVSSKFPPEQLFGELEPTDLHWACESGFVTETQTFYTITEEGSSVMCQVIHSSVSVWFPTIQFTCKIYNPKTKESIWRSINVTNFVTPPSPALDKRSSKADEFSITYKSDPESSTPESYTILANLSSDLQISLQVSRPESVPGFKIGTGPKGGYSYFGPNEAKPEGYVIHRFWPRTFAEGHLIHKGAALPVKGPGMLVHAIQGMRPDLVASRWNFADFQSDAHGGVSAIQMELTTTNAFGRNGSGSGGVKVNIGSLVVGGKLVCVTAETKWPDEDQPDSAHVISRASHLNTFKDADTGYHQPSRVEYKWAGPSLAEGGGTIEASLAVDVGGSKDPKGLIEKVDLLAEIPYVVKMAVNYVAGTKPYIYQWLNPVKLILKGPESILPGLSEGVEVDGMLYSEATFIT